MPIHIKLFGDQVRIRYSGAYFEQYRAIIRSINFAQFDVQAKSWVFPIHLFDRIIPLLPTLPEPAEIDKELYDRILDNRVAVEKTKALRKKTDCDFVPGGFKGKLLPFQAIGSQFLIDGRRVIMGDDVGLGKTVQCCGAMAELFERGEIESVLIVAPGHIKRQWIGEIEKFTFLETTLVEGSPPRRRELLGSTAPIVITNYDLLPRDPEYLQRDWGLIILDETQEIKNFRTKSAKITKKLRAKFKWAVTATPLENSLPELHSIFDFICPGLLGQWWEFERRFIDRDIFGGICGYRNLDELTEMIKPYLIRRRVDDCLSDFPKKVTKIVYRGFLREEGVVYQDVNKQVLQSIEDKARTERINHAQKMNQVGFLRQACDHSLLVSDEFDYPSAKMEWLKAVMEEVRNRGEKAVIFTEWSRMARIIRKELGDCPMLSGQLNFRARHEVLERWKKSDEPLVTTDCANVGLNLQQANWLISYEMHWNPAVMKQRIGRVHRLTQDKTVHVRAPVIRGTIEEKVLEALAGKVDLFKTVIDSIALKARKVSRNDRGTV